MDSPQVNCTACVHWSGEHVFHCLKARTLTICMDKWCIYFEPKEGIEMPIITENKPMEYIFKRPKIQRHH